MTDILRQRLYLAAGTQKRGSETIDVDSFIAGKSIRAKGKRVTAFEVESVKFTEPIQKGRGD
jgi:hypothetical protein